MGQMPLCAHENTGELYYYTKITDNYYVYDKPTTKVLKSHV